MSLYLSFIFFQNLIDEWEITLASLKEIYGNLYIAMEKNFLTRIGADPTSEVRGGDFSNIW